MNMVFLGIGVLIVLLIIIIVIFLLSGDKKKPQSTVKHNSNINSSIKLSDLKFPSKIEEINTYSLFQATKIIIDSYNAMEYLKKTPNSMDKMEWHTWQFSILLKFLKENKEFILPYDMNIFHSVILNFSKEDINKELQKIFTKYNNNVDITKNRDHLSKDTIWSGMDVSVILYMILSKNNN